MDWKSLESLRKWPRWVREDATQRALESFGDYLCGRHVSHDVAAMYVKHVARGWADVEGYLLGLPWQACKHAKYALVHYARWKRRPSLIPLIQAVPEPIKGPRRPVHVPDFQRWRELGPELLQRNPGPLGHVLWVLVYSGLRISDVLLLRRPEVIQAGLGADAIVRQKGGGHARRRDWRPAGEILPACRSLAAVPGWSELWQSFSGSLPVARQRARAAIPSPHTPHDFRRTFATYHYSLGADLLVIAQMGGWESPSSVERYIVHVPSERVDYFRRRMSLALFPHGTPYDRPTR